MADEIKQKKVYLIVADTLDSAMTWWRSNPPEVDKANSCYVYCTHTEDFACWKISDKCELVRLHGWMDGKSADFIRAVVDRCP